jgi:hypothetical protein
MTALDDIRFIDSARPAVPAGDYRITVTQHVRLPGEYDSPAPYRHEQPIRVAGPHLGLAPDDVVSVYPPAHADGDFGTSLCHAVLRRPGLPWEIAPTSGAAAPPWLAILLLTAADLDPAADLAAAETSGVRGVPLAEYLRPPAGVVGPDLPTWQRERWLAEQPDRDCTVVDVLAPAFAALAPRAAELPLLAHVRETTGEDGVDRHAVVLGNRLPVGAADGQYLAHLVSLEGFVPRLADRDGLPPDCRAVRLLSLARWSFTSTPAGPYFAELAEALDCAPMRLPLAAGPPSGPAATPIERVVDGGYVPVDYRTRLGERTVAWYRGPLLPVSMARAVQPGYPVAEAALIYDEETGMFDLSFAVAWQTGRLLALADRAFTTTLLSWVRAQQRAAQLMVERGALPAGSVDGAGCPADRLAERLVRRHLAGTLAAGTAAGPAHSAPPPGDPTARSVLAAGDPTGLSRHHHRLTGLLGAGEVAAMLDAGTDPRDALIERWRRHTATPAGPGWRS